jgi:hypothetical protein
MSEQIKKPNSIGRPSKAKIGLVKPRKDPTKQKKKYESVNCECGGRFSQKDLKRHLETRKHRQFFGEVLEPLTRNKKSNVNCYLNYKIDDLTLEQREIRREYFRIANIHYRARKKLEEEKEKEL